MRINKFLFPIILLIIFLGVIALGMMAGYWKTKGGRGRQSQIPAPVVVTSEIRIFDSFNERQSL